MALSPGTRLGPYEITASIGVGGMGEVYRATDTNLKRQVAIKVLPASVARDAERLARFQREAEVLAQLNHPNIAHVYGVEDTPEAKALVMELVDGPTLADRITQGAIPVDEALPIARQTAEALEAAHEQGIIHRDLKPANVKVRSDGTVKVLDFGLAKAVDAGAAGSQGPAYAQMSQVPTIATPAMTQVGVILGTAPYMSPEQARGKPVDKRSDAWAFGCVLYEMLTGKRAFEGEDMSEAMAAVLTKAPDWGALPSRTPAEVTTVLKLCLQKDPRRRLRDLGDAALALDGAFATTSPTPGFAARRARWGFAAIIGALMLTGVLGSIALWNARRQAAPGETARVSLLLPADGPIYFGGTTRSTLAIAPDGRAVVYMAAAESDARSELRLRSLDSPETRRIPGTETGVQPFFSPDGRWVAFFTQRGELKKVALAGGAPITLHAELNGGVFHFGSWTDDNQIVFGTSSRAMPLERVSADGGMPAPLTTLDTAQGETRHAYPHYIPGSRTVLFTVVVSGTSPRIDAVDLDTGERRTVLDNAGQGRVVMRDRLLFQRGETILVAPFDPERLVLTGPPQPLSDAIRRDGQANDGSIAQLAVSREGTLAFVPEVNTLQRVVLVNRRGEAEALDLPPARYRGLAASPDGRYVALEVQGADPTSSQVLVYNRTRGTTTTLSPRGPESSPSWRPDGSALAVMTSRQADRSGLYQIELGGAERMLVASRQGQPVRNSSWRPDGRQLAYTVQDGSAHDIWVVDVDDRLDTRQLLASPASEYGPRFSPDGRWLAYTSDTSGRLEIYVKRYPEGATLPVSTRGGLGAVWRRDGKELFYQELSGARQTIMAVSVTEAGGALRLGAPAPLFAMRTFDEAGSPWVYAYSSNAGPRWDVLPDGRFLMLQVPDTSVNREIVIIQNWSTELARLAPMN